MGAGLPVMGTMGDKASKEEKYPWAGPALFTTVLIAILVFFWWLV